MVEQNDESGKSSKTADTVINKDVSTSIDLDHAAAEEHGLDSQYENNETMRPFFFSRIPKFLRFDNAPIEATGCAINMWGRATLLMASIFLGPALLELASIQAQKQSSCEIDDDDCLGNAKVYGFKPSSLLANIATVSGVMSAVSSPIVGAIIDHTPHRRLLGVITASLLTLIKIIEIGVLSSFWFIVAWMSIASAILFQLQATVIYAYSSELSDKTDSQSKFQSYFFMILYMSSFISLIAVLLPGFFFNFNDIDIARCAIVISIITTCPCFFISWKYLFRNRPPLSQLSPGSSLWTIGFIKLYHTYKEVRSEFPAVGWFLKGLIFAEAAHLALITIATTYMSEFLHMTAMEIGLTILTNLLSGIPGAFIGNFFCQRYSNPVFSAKLCLLLFIVNTTAASLILTPSNKGFIYLFGIIWGVCSGWMHPQQTTIFVTITPAADSMRWMGLFLFACQILSFLPPLLFTIFNEAGWSMQWGMASLNIFFLLGLVGLCGIGDYSKALVVEA
mmetsp:Transcript_32673/g.48382  ORF Transcript_32673/g.48382 Transcript_32673/m.48382 type:complete len:506 (+) Transcript_32673:158-1675(+)